MNKLIYLIVLTVLLFSGCIGAQEGIITPKTHDVVEYNIAEEYFVYIDGENIIKISWDSTGWSPKYNLVHLIQSDKLYVEEFNDGWNKPTYKLYLNLTKMRQ